MRAWVCMVVVLAVFALAGCQGPTVRDAPSGGDATGQLGSPLVGPSPADVYVGLSGAYLSEGNLSEAFKNAKKAVIVDPKSSNAFYMQALVYQRLGELAEAESSYLQAIELDPLRETGYRALIHAELGRGDSGAAMRAYQRCERTITEQLGVPISASTRAMARSRTGLPPVTKRVLAIAAAASAPRSRP